MPERYRQWNPYSSDIVQNYSTAKGFLQSSAPCFTTFDTAVPQSLSVLYPAPAPDSFHEKWSSEYHQSLPQMYCQPH